MCDISEFDLSSAVLQDKPAIEPFAVPDRGRPLQAAALKPAEGLLLIERGGIVKTFLLKQMVYHHIAHGEIAGEPYLISCGKER